MCHDFQRLKWDLLCKLRTPPTNGWRRCSKIHVKQPFSKIHVQTTMLGTITTSTNVLSENEHITVPLHSFAFHHHLSCLSTSFVALHCDFFLFVAKSAGLKPYRLWDDITPTHFAFIRAIIYFVALIFQLHIWWQINHVLFIYIPN